MSLWSSFIPGGASPAPPASAIMLVAPCHPTGCPQNMLKWQQLARFLVWLAGNNKDDWGYEGFKQTYLILTPDGTNVLHWRFSPNYIHCFNHLIIYSANDKHASGLMKDGKFTEGFPAMCFFHRKCVPATAILSCQCTLTTLALCVPEVQLALWQRQCARKAPVPQRGGATSMLANSAQQLSATESSRQQRRCVPSSFLLTGCSMRALEEGKTTSPAALV